MYTIYDAYRIPSTIYVLEMSLSPQRGIAFAFREVVFFADIFFILIYIIT